MLTAWLSLASAVGRKTNCHYDAVVGTPTAFEGGRFQILAFDGGGVKGLFSAAVLAAIEDDLQITATDHFDLITGTSTGGIIALGLGLGLRPRDIVEFYVQNAEVMFEDRWGWRRFLHYFHRKYPQEALAQALRRAFGNQLLGHSRKRLVVPSYNLGADDIYLFKTPHIERLRRDWRVPAWQVALATASAPTYFPGCRHVDGMRLVDGGIWANNPVMVGIVEAVGLLGVPLGAIRVLSLGTTNAVVRRPEGLDRGGLWQWRRVAIDAALRGQSRGAYTQACHLLPPGAAQRLDPQVPEGLFELDRVTTAGLIAAAAHASRAFCPVFEAHFRGHLAAPYQPFHIDNAEGPVR